MREIEKDLFYYIFENDENAYNEITNLIIELSDTEIDVKENEIFLKDFYFRLLFKIAIMEHKGDSIDEIITLLNISKNIKIFDSHNIEQLLRKYSIVIDKIKEYILKLEKDIIIKDE